MISEVRRATMSLSSRADFRFSPNHWLINLQSTNLLNDLPCSDGAFQQVSCMPPNPKASLLELVAFTLTLKTTACIQV